MNVVLIGKTRTGDDASQGNIFRVIISVSLQSLYEEPKDQYNPRFTDSTETNLNYTTDSSVDMSYTLYKTGLENTIYASGDYRTLSSTVQLPAGTRITMRDYGQGDNVNKVYNYQIGSNTAYDSTETVDGKTRYVYKLSHFRDIGTNTTDFTGTGNYTNNNSSYYHSGADASGYVFEKYDISGVPTSVAMLPTLISVPVRSSYALFMRTLFMYRTGDRPTSAIKPRRRVLSLVWLTARSFSSVISDLKLLFTYLRADCTPKRSHS